MSFAQNLKYIKEKENLTNYRLAKLFGCSQSSLINWLDNGVVPHPKTRQKIADHFGITLAELDGDELPVLPPEGAKKVPAREDEDDLREDQKIMANLLKRMTVEERKNFINAAVAALKE